MKFPDFSGLLGLKFMPKSVAIQTGNMTGEVGARANSCSPLHNAASSNTNSDLTKVISVTDFFYDDSTVPYVALPEP
ncbi:MAG: hypothetical protein WCA39_09020 [Nitrososphaeraceae archaeon]